MTSDLMTSYFLSKSQHSSDRFVHTEWKYVDFREARFRGIDEDKLSKGMIAGF